MKIYHVTLYYANVNACMIVTCYMNIFFPTHIILLVVES